MGRKRTGGIDDRGTRRYARITVTLENGKTKRKRVRIDAGLPARNARRVARDISKEAEGYVFDEVEGESAALSSSPTVDDYHTEWAKERARKGRYSEKGRYVTHVHPVLGKKRMADVGKNDARALSAALDDKVQANKLHWSTAAKAWALAKKMFKDAVDSKIAALRVLESNPFDGVQGPDRCEKKGKQWLYPSEALALLACDDVPVRWKRLYALSMYLYLRPGELAALEWADVNLDRGYVHVHQAFDLQSGELKSTKTGTTRKVPIKLELRPLLETMKTEVGGKGLVVQNTHENKLAEHGMPPTEDLAEKLRLHLWRAEVRRADLHDDRPGTKKVTFYDLRATGITWEALAKTEFLAIMQRAGHRESKTTLGYIREAEAVGIDAGEPFPALPLSLIVATDTGHNRKARALGLSTPPLNAGNSAGRVGCRVASPRGFEPLLQP
jgi:integrase